MEYLRYLRILNIRECVEWGSNLLEIVDRSLEYLGKFNFFFFLREENVVKLYLFCLYRNIKKLEY